MDKKSSNKNSRFNVLFFTEAAKSNAGIFDSLSTNENIYNMNHYNCSVST